MNERERDNLLEKQHFLTTLLKQEENGKHEKSIVCMIYARSDASWHTDLPEKRKETVFPVRIQFFPTTGERRIFTNLFGTQTELSDASEYVILDWDKAQKTVYPRFVQCFGMAYTTTYQ